MKKFLTGGAVRDRLLGRRTKDLDYSVEAESFEAMLAEVEVLAVGGKVFEVRPEHYTVRANLPDTGPADFVLCRREGPYSDGRRPDWVRPGTLLDDLARRDFSVNAMCFLPDGTLFDPHNGKADLADMVLRCVGDPHDRFFEDSLRLARAVRFMVTHGFTLHATVAAAMRDPGLVARLDNASVNRVQAEMQKAFACDTVRALEVLDGFPLLRAKMFSRGLRLFPTLKQ